MEYLNTEQNVDTTVSDPTKDIFSKLPEEVWNVIFEYLKNSPQDFLSLCTASRYLNNVFNGNKVAWLFKLILPYIFNGLDKTEILNCRIVCKRWNHAVDNFLEDHISRQPFDKKRHPTKYLQVSPRFQSLQFKKMDYNFTFHNYKWWDGEDKANSFRLSLENHPRNPFVGRSLSFSLKNELDFLCDGVGGVTECLFFSGYWDQALKFISKLGKQIWYFKIVDRSTQQQPEPFYRKLVQCLKHLPNLRSLDISVIICDTYLDYDNFDDDEVISFMENDPLPELSHLNTLILNEVKNVPQLLIYDNIIHSYAGQLCRLDAPLNMWQDEYKGRMKKLQELHLEWVKRYDQDEEYYQPRHEHPSVIEKADSDRRLNMFKKLDLLDIPSLQKLSLHLDQRITLPSLLEVLERFPSLVALRLNFAKECNEYDCEVSLSSDLEVASAAIINANSLAPSAEQGAFSTIASVETLEILENHVSLLYNFLVRFPSLKQLYILEMCNQCGGQPFTPATAENTANEVVEVHKYMYGKGEMVKSNIWKLLPFFKTFLYERIAYGVENQVFEQFCNRSMYDFHQKLTK